MFFEKNQHAIQKIYISILAVVSITVLLLILSPTVLAADARNYNAGKIVDDDRFTDSDSMTVGEIQKFLESKVDCDEMGREPSEYGGGTRAQFAKNYLGVSTPFTCLPDYYENPDNGKNNYGKSTRPAGSISAAQIIHKYSQQFDINPQAIVVTLQKENGMVTDEWPTPKQYSEAMGFGCPDHTAPGAPACDPSYGSFSTQVYQAARHFRGFINNSPGWWIPFNTGSNQIAWHPNTACGSGRVNIQNRATVALYSYTPYQPNDAAKRAQYGTGDGCSSYGNRNFYLYFNDWFGVRSDIVRTANSAQVYLIAGDHKYPINTFRDLRNFSRLGPVTFVSQSYLNSKTTGNVATNLVKSESSSTLYFINAGIKLPFTSCAVAADYSRPCGAQIELTESQINKFSTGPAMTKLYKTTTGVEFYINDGRKREVFDQQSAEAMGVNGSYYNVLLESGIDHLTYGSPVIREDVIAKSRASGKSYLFQNGKFVELSDDLLSTNYFSQIASEDMQSASISSLPHDEYTGGLVQDGSLNKYIINKEGVVAVPSSASSDLPAGIATLDATFVSKIPDGGDYSPFIKTYNSSTIYMLVDGTRHPIFSWDDFIGLHENKSSAYLNVLPAMADRLPLGGAQLVPGSLVRARQNPSVFVVTGLRTKSPLSTFEISREIGLSGVRYLDEGTLNRYTTKSPMSKLSKCGSEYFVANLGLSYKVNSTSAELYGINLDNSTEWDQVGCTAIKKSEKALSEYRFIKESDKNTIYFIENGKKRPISSMAKYRSLGSESDKLLIVSEYLAAGIDSGSTI